ncbi:MAG: hypothetical protein KatS3mg121_0002 [Gammaproteobacteria bacterium]|nr:MAG: hypothetical protein KatS3mg121_0002 [Gammaproteobacteria bacterium]
MTRDGLWLGRNWLRVPARGGEQAGVLARAQQIKALRREREDAEAAVGRLESALAEAREALAAAERAREALQNTRSELEQRRAALRAALRAVEVRLEQLQKRRNELAREREELTRQIESDRRAREAAQREREAARAESESLAAERGRLETRRTELAEALEAARRTAQADQQAVHEAALNIQSMRSMKESTERSLLRMQQQLDHLESRRGELLAALNEDHEPVAELEQQLAALLERRVAEEARLNAARAEAEEAANAVRELEQRRGEQARRVGELREALDALRLAAQEARVRAQALAEQFDETGLDRAAVLAELPEDADPDAWAEKLHKVEARIARLGPINLAAIDEHREQAERKAYLDKQHADLTEALETLERAITKIDRETRARFKDVFDRVNAALKDMFPRLFGGGHAHLEMTGDDLLSTGVAIMARPPGKRISNIHLLSGGEKALTAVAMVFAIFSLNPAPFCMLDEVDAPLDEANVARFNELLKEMSEKVQFIAITHNKTTMEMADQLIGVTMREPGVSRIVAVDIDEAVRLASA